MSNTNLAVNEKENKTGKPQQQIRKQMNPLYPIKVTDDFSFTHYDGNTGFYDHKAKYALGVVVEVHKDKFTGDPNGEYVLGGGWSCKWYKILDSYVLKLKTSDLDKRKLLERGVIHYFMSKGLIKFHAVALSKAKIKYRIQLVETLVTIINNEGYLQAFKHHPAYNEVYLPHLSREWVTRWCQNIDLHNTGIFKDSCCSVLFELVKMVKVVVKSEELRQKLESKRTQSELEKKIKSVATA